MSDTKDNLETFHKILIILLILSLTSILVIAGYGFDMLYNQQQNIQEKFHELKSHANATFIDCQPKSFNNSTGIMSCTNGKQFTLIGTQSIH
jgi:hypothetical protein